MIKYTSLALKELMVSREDRQIKRQLCYRVKNIIPEENIYNAMRAKCLQNFLVKLIQ